jgi:arsenate reductase
VDPPSEKEIEFVLEKLDFQPRELMRKSEAEYKQFFTEEGLTNAQLIALMHKYPKVIERPIVINNDKVAIGRPPESVLDIL